MRDRWMILLYIGVALVLIGGIGAFYLASAAHASRPVRIVDPIPTAVFLGRPAVRYQFIDPSSVRMQMKPYGGQQSRWVRP